MPSINQPEQVKESVKVEIKRDRASNTMRLVYSVPESVERILKSMPHEVKESVKWPNNKFYFVPTLTKNREYKNLCATYDVFDNFGDDLINEDGRMNIAWVRTVGGTGDIELNENVGISEAQTLVRNTTAFIRDYYNNFHRPVSIRGEVVIESA